MTRRRGEGRGEGGGVRQVESKWIKQSESIYHPACSLRASTERETQTTKGEFTWERFLPPPPKKKTQIRLTEDEKKRLDKRKNLIRLGASSNASAAVSFIVPVLLFCYQQLSALFCFISRSPAVSHSTSLRTFSSDSDHSYRLLGSVPRHGFVRFFVCFIL